LVIGVCSLVSFGKGLDDFTVVLHLDGFALGGDGEGFLGDGVFDEVGVSDTLEDVIEGALGLEGGSVVFLVEGFSEGSDYGLDLLLEREAHGGEGHFEGVL
jgi:hypothetical protein